MLFKIPRDPTWPPRLLVFGGSFDPPHRAHVELPEHVRAAIAANAVLYIPTARSPFKHGREGTAAERRMRMTELAVAGRPRSFVLPIEAMAPGDGPTYTVDTLDRLVAMSPPDIEYRLLIGADQLASFDRWREAARIVELADPVVMRRPGEDIDAALAHAESTLGWTPRVVDAPLIDVSSTEVRRRVADGEPLGDLVAPAVADYIAEHGLYAT